MEISDSNVEMHTKPTVREIYMYQYKSSVKYNIINWGSKIYLQTIVMLQTDKNILI